MAETVWILYCFGGNGWWREDYSTHPLMFRDRDAAAEKIKTLYCETVTSYVPERAFVTRVPGGVLLKNSRLMKITNDGWFLRDPTDG